MTVRSAMFSVEPQNKGLGIQLSVVLPAYNPRIDYIEIALDGLRKQTLSTSKWELIIVDNASDFQLVDQVDCCWHPNSKIIREHTLGLTHARLAGFSQSKADVVVLVDDDNVLAADYLDNVLKISNEHPYIGVWGGGITPRFESPKLALPSSLYPLLTLRTSTQDLWSNDPNHHSSTPWGAGLCVRQSVAKKYIDELYENPKRVLLDLNGSQLLYGGDTDISYTACRAGFGKGVFRCLQLEHLISAHRCKEEYLCRVAEGRGYSEILHYFLLHNQLPAKSSRLFDWARRLKRSLNQSQLEQRVDIAFERGRKRAWDKLSGKTI